MRTLLLFVALTAQFALAADVVTGIPDHGRRFKMPMDPADTIGSVYKCEARIHRRRFLIFGKHGTGVCQIPPGSINSGKHNRLDLLYPNVLVSVK